MRHWPPTCSRSAHISDRTRSQNRCSACLSIRTRHSNASASRMPSTYSLASASPSSTTTAATAARRGRSTAVSRRLSATSCGRVMGYTAPRWPARRLAGRCCWRSSMITPRVRRVAVGHRRGRVPAGATLRSGLMTRGVPAWVVTPAAPRASGSVAQPPPGVLTSRAGPLWRSAGRLGPGRLAGPKLPRCRPRNTETRVKAPVSGWRRCRQPMAALMRVTSAINRVAVVVGIVLPDRASM